VVNTADSDCFLSAGQFPWTRLLQAKLADLLAVSRGRLSLGVRTVDAQGHPATYRRSSRPWSPAGAIMPSNNPTMADNWVDFLKHATTAKQPHLNISSNKGGRQAPLSSGLRGPSTRQRCSLLAQLGMALLDILHFQGRVIQGRVRRHRMATGAAVISMAGWAASPGWRSKQCSLAGGLVGHRACASSGTAGCRKHGASGTATDGSKSASLHV
jgi:hypothetical protein